jgi:hypothetical protein
MNNYYANYVACSEKFMLLQVFTQNIKYSVHCRLYNLKKDNVLYKIFSLFIVCDDINLNLHSYNSSFVIPSKKLVCIFSPDILIF